MGKSPFWKQIRSFLVLVLITAGALAVSMPLSHINNDNNPFAMAVFILSVALVARMTDGYFWGIAASVAGTFCVNYFFTYPFWSFDITYPGYSLTIIVMLIVSILISTLTTRIKRQQLLRLEMEREKMRADLLRAIAHDIRTPLSTILGASSSLQEQQLSREDQASLISGIQREAEWLVRVTENLLSVTRFSGNDVVLKKDDEVLEEIIGSAVIKYHHMAGSLPVRVEETRDILIVSADAMLLEQVLINLFENVSDHAEGASQIWLHIPPEPDRVILSVEDDGKGIPSAMLPHLLDESIKNTNHINSDKKRNMGIGLSVCRSIIQAHGGELSAGRSTHGGAAIWFYLPRGEEDDGISCSEQNFDY